MLITTLGIINSIGVIQSPFPPNILAWVGGSIIGSLHESLPNTNSPSTPTLSTLASPRRTHTAINS